MSTLLSRSPAEWPLRDKLAQLLFVRIGSNLPPVCTAEQDADRVARLLEAYPLGGLIMFNGQRDQTARTLDRLQQASKYPLLVGADIERGIGQQVRGYTLFPHAMAFDALGEQAEQCVYEFARLTGVAARHYGIHITFSPVADVNTNPRNPIIATRAFGDDPHRVAQLVAAFVHGCAAGGVLCTAKHFPGHGNTHEDSHHALPAVHTSPEQLTACDLVPFRAAIAAGAPLMMTAHVAYPALDASKLPATLSRPILVDLLRRELHFTGAVVSDSLLMEGVKSQHASEGEIVLQTLLAGVDIQLDISDPGQVLDELELAVDRGQLPVERVDEAFNRLIALKDTIFARPEPADRREPLDATLQLSEALAKKVATSAIRATAAQRTLAPLATDRELCVVVLRPHQSHLDPAELPLGAFLRERFARCEYRELGPVAIAADYAGALQSMLAAEQAVIAMVVKPAAWFRFGLLDQQDQFVREVTNQRPCLVASLGSPIALEAYTHATERVCTYSDVFVSQRALAEYLCSASAR